MKKIITFLITILTLTSYAQQNKIWGRTNLKEKNKSTQIVKNNLNEVYYNLNIKRLKNELKKVISIDDNKTKSKIIIIGFPNVEGEIVDYKVQEYTIMHPELAAKFPSIKSYKGVNVNDKLDKIYFSVSDKAIQSMSLSEGKKDVFIKHMKNSQDLYKVYHRKGKEDDFICNTINELKGRVPQNNVQNRNADDSILRTYRIAISVTGEYTGYHGGTKVLALAAINATMTRVNAVFEKILVFECSL